MASVDKKLSLQRLGEERSAPKTSLGTADIEIQSSSQIEEQLVESADQETISRLISEVKELAQKEGMIDLAYTTIQSPIGELLLVSTSIGLIRIAFADENHEDVLSELADKVSPRILEFPRRLDRSRQELDEYFDGKRRRFDIDLDFTLVKGFRRVVLEQTFAQVPYGQTASYTEVAAAAKRPKAVRAAASALANNPIPIIVPCHRILRLNGGLGGYAGGLDRKVRLLELEGSL